MPHREKNKHRPRHRTRDIKPANLPKPLPPKPVVNEPVAPVDTTTVLPEPIEQPLPLQP